MKTKFFYSAILIVGLVFLGSASINVCGQTSKKDNLKTTKSTTIVQHLVKYTCPEHPDVMMDKPGKCPKCGMALVEKKIVKKTVKEETKMGDMKKMSKMDNEKITKTTSTVQHMVKYTCPEHPAVMMDKPGKCPKCGMALVEKKITKKTVRKEVKMGEMEAKKDTATLKHKTKHVEMKMK